MERAATSSIVERTFSSARMSRSAYQKAVSPGIQVGKHAQTENGHSFE